MGSTGAERVRLNAASAARTVTVGGHDERAVRAAVTGRFATLLGDPAGVVLTSSCTSALEAAATVLDLAPGDEVVVPAFTFSTTATAFAARGATLRFADVSAATGNVDPASLATKLGPRTRAVVVVHYAGVAADLDAVAGLLAGRAVDVVEDAAQGLFGTHDGRALGTFGRFGCISLHRTKNLSVLEGGALVVNRADDLKRVHIAVDKGTDRVEFDEGRRSSYEWSGLGSAARMPEAAVRLLASELDRAEAVQGRRHQVWHRYETELAGWAETAGVGLPVVPPARGHPAHIFFVVLPSAADRDPFVRHCAEQGVEVARHFGSLPSTPYGRSIARPEDRCPVAEDLALRLVRLPLHHDLDDADVDRVVAAVTGW